MWYQNKNGSAFNLSTLLHMQPIKITEITYDISATISVCPTEPITFLIENIQSEDSNTCREKEFIKWIVFMLTTEQVSCTWKNFEDWLVHLEINNLKIIR